MERRGERTALIVRVVRGEAPLTALATVGIVPHFEGNRLTFENPHRLEAPIAIQDLATGLLAEHHEPGYRSEAAYRRWAFTMMAWEYADFPFDDAAADDPLSVEKFRPRCPLGRILRQPDRRRDATGIGDGRRRYAEHRLITWS